MKRIVRVTAWALCAAMMSMVFSGCGAPDNADESGASAPESSEPSSVAASPAPESAPESAVESEPASSSPESSAPPESSASETQEPPPPVPAPETSNIVEPMPKNPFIVDEGEAYDLYVYHPYELAYGLIERYMYVSGPPDVQHPIIEELNSLPSLSLTRVAPGVMPETGFLIIRGEFEKTQINLLGNVLEVNGAFYSITAEQHNRLRSLADEAVASIGAQSYGKYPHWLVWMNPNRVTAIDCVDETGREFSVMQSNLWTVSMWTLRDIACVSGSGTSYVPGSMDFSALNDAFRFDITFDSEVVYTVVMAGENMYVESSDMNYACWYKINPNRGESVGNALKSAELEPANPATAKPVIYLYPQREQDVSVKLDFKGELSYTYPAYNGGWNVTASPDGRLVNKADGSEHYYLFWEGTADFTDWDFSEGFVVKGAQAEAFLLEKLPALGLTPREYNDFITYWAPEMSRNAYNLVTFAYAQYEAAAPLQVSPAPDTVLRVHMVYKAIPEPVAVKEQELPPAPERKGFTVVEWGGTRA